MEFALGFVLGGIVFVVAYNQALKRSPERLRAMLDKLAELDDKRRE